MKLKFMAAGALLLSMVVASCNDTTDTIGQTLTDNMDQINISTDTFYVSSRSIKAGPVLSRTATGNLGRMIDPETGSYVTGDITTKFHVLSSYNLPEKEKLYSYHKKGEILADSCEIRFYFADQLGDSLATMKATLYELAKPLQEDGKYYTDFDPMKEGYVRTDKNAVKIGKAYTLCDYTITKKEREASNHANNIRIRITGPYTDKEGKEYPDFGTYILRSYYEHPEYFFNSQSFANHICPGFFLKSEAGSGSMAYIYATNMNVFYRSVDNDSVAMVMPFSGTEEVMQHSTITNDDKIDELVEDNTCTYLKTPAGIFTEMTLPVDDIMKGHENDTLNTVKVSLTKLNNKVMSDYSLDTATDLLMIPKDSLNTFFESNKGMDNKTSYLASIDGNSYTYSNISELVHRMHDKKLSGNYSEDWNKVVIIPVEYQSTAVSTTTSYYKMNHQMTISSTRLVGGPENPNGPIKLSVIYSKFSKK